MNQNEMNSMVRDALHAIKTHLSPVMTFVELEQIGTPLPDRHLLISRAHEGLKQIATEIEQLSLKVRKKEGE